ncbi:MAG: glycosyltransferase family 9 protein, partial [Candidatus Omnitrophica bacterium]|nr:glycosyltransferase family 9 protein [Candidatus Omnitrophota bacterium]
MQKLTMQPDKNVKKILAVRTDRFGEFLLNIPALRALKETFPQARLTLITSPAVKELAELIPFADEVIVFDEGEDSFFGVLRAVAILRKSGFDLAVILNPAKFFHIATFLAGIPVRAGYGRKWGFLLTHKIKDTKYAGDMHEIDYNLELVRQVGAKTEDKRLSLDIGSDIINTVLKPLLPDKDRFIVVHPWTSDPVKQWPLTHFKELTLRLLKEFGYGVVVIGGKAEKDKSRELFGNISDNRLIELTGKTSLKDLAYILKSSMLLISGDSGPVHLASCADVPVIALFRNDLQG